MQVIVFMQPEVVDVAAQRDWMSEARKYVYIVLRCTRRVGQQVCHKVWPGRLLRTS